jgi:nicotinamidase-related amidase
MAHQAQYGHVNTLENTPDISTDSVRKKPMSLKPRTEKGLLTPDNCVVTLIDHQPQMLFGVTSIDRQTLINNVIGFAEAAKIFGVPVILSTVETKAFSGNIWPQLQAVYPKQTPIERSSMNSWDDENFVAAVKNSGKKKIVLAGLWTQVCVTFPSIQAINDGYEVYVVEDLCGDLDQRTHEAAMRRVEQAGAKPVTWIQVMLEWQRDWAQKETYAPVMDVVKNHAGAYGMGVEYAYTMVHGSAPTVYQGWEVPAELIHS